LAPAKRRVPAPRRERDEELVQVLDAALASLDRLLDVVVER